MIRRRSRPLLIALAGVAAATVVLLGFEANPFVTVMVPLVVGISIGWSSRYARRLSQAHHPVRSTVEIPSVELVADATGTVLASGHTVAITIAASGPAPVVLERLRPVVTDRGGPAGQLSVQFGIVDFPLTVSPGRPKLLSLVALAREHEVGWFLELDTVCLGRTGTTRIDLAGKPFRTKPRGDEPRIRR